MKKIILHVTYFSSLITILHSKLQKWSVHIMSKLLSNFILINGVIFGDSRAAAHIAQRALIFIFLSRLF